MRPKPMIPKVFPCSSTPRNVLRSQIPAFIEASAAGTFRARARRRAKVCSVADIRLAVGALTTRMPSSVAASTSTLSTPIPARPTTLRFLPAAKSSFVTLVMLRTTRAS